MPARELLVTRGDSGVSYNSSDVNAQTITPVNTHRCMSVRLKVYGYDDRGDVDVELQGVDVNGKPDGVSIASGIIPAAELAFYHNPTTKSTQSVEVSFGAGAVVTSGTVYAIVVSYVGGGDPARYLVWRVDTSSPAYGGGSRFTSADGGSSWTEDTSDDFLFLERDGRRLYEHNQSWGNGGTSVYHGQWAAQMFLAASTYNIYGVGLQLYKGSGDTPGVYTISIRAAADGGSGILPTGPDLASGTFYTNNLSKYSQSAGWIYIPFTALASIVSGNHYAIVIQASAGSSISNLVYWNYTASSNTPDVDAVDSKATSANQGSTWTKVAGAVSQAFRCFGGEWSWDEDTSLLSVHNYNVTGYLPIGSLSGATWVNQIFKCEVASRITSIKLKMYRSGSPGTITASLQLLDGSRDPDGSDIVGTVGTYNGDSLTTDTDGEWVEFTCSGVDLTLGTEYAIVVRALSGDNSNWAAVKINEESITGSYVLSFEYGGSSSTSYDSGSSWSESPDYNILYEVWGTLPLTAPTVTVHPISQTKNVDDSVTFSITATGYPVPTYQWYKDGSPISGETLSSLTFTVIGISGGDYTCVATNSEGSDTSNAATLSVIPSITAQSSATAILLGQSGSLYVTAVGHPAVTYQWYKDGNSMSGETSATLSLNFVETADAGTYTCTVTNGVGSDTSDSIVVTIKDNPYTRNPFNLTLDSGRTG